MRECARCKKSFDGFPAISRKDNKTEICPECARLEAVEAYRDFIEAEDNKA